MDTFRQLLISGQMALCAILSFGCLKPDGSTPHRPTRTHSPADSVAARVTQSPSAVTLRGQVRYDGSQPPSIRMLKPTKHQELAPPEVPGEGWYVDPESRGVRFAVVFLRPPTGKPLPAPSPEALALPPGSDGQPLEVQTLRMPNAQYEPRVLCLHPRQKLKLVNDGKFP